MIVYACTFITFISAQCFVFLYYSKYCQCNLVKQKKDGKKILYKICADTITALTHADI